MKALLKACARCRGDLLMDASDRECRTYVCLQCGACAQRPRQVAASMEASEHRSAAAHQVWTAKH
jgi:hypothetical protein